MREITKAGFILYTLATSGVRSTAHMRLPTKVKVAHHAFCFFNFHPHLMQPLLMYTFQTRCHICTLILFEIGYNMLVISDAVIHPKKIKLIQTVHPSTCISADHSAFLESGLKMMTLTKMTYSSHLAITVNVAFK